MNRLLNYLPLHFVVLCILGICFQFFTQFWTFNFFDTLFFIAFLSLLFLIIKHRVLRTFTSFVLFFFLGVSSVCIHDDRKQDTFYEPYLEENSIVILQIHKVLKSGNYNYEAKVVKVDDTKTTGKLLLNIKKDATSKRLNVDELLLLKPVLKDVIQPLNPHQFNYKLYLATQGIYDQIFVEYNQIFRLNSDGITFFGRSAKLITFIQESLQKYNFKKNELAVINALILGQRQEISTELIANYQKAGAIHILAVSGLHIGIILLFISFLLTPLEKN